MTTDPAEVFVDLARDHDRMFWLDGGGSREWSGRRSLLGALSADDVSLTYDGGTRRVTRHTSHSEVVGDDIFGVLEEELRADGGDPSVHWVGYFGYAARPDLPALVDPRVPDAVWMRVRDPVIIEHPPTHPGPPALGEPRGPVPPDYAAAYAEVQRQLRLGNSYEVNLTYRESVHSEADPVAAYLRLRSANAGPYSGFLRHHDVRLLSSSPERFATVDRLRWLEAKPIKGTTARSTDAVTDRAEAERLGNDAKFRAENLMIVDLLRNDLAIVCEPGTVTVPTLMEVESYPSVHQLVSTIRGHLRDDIATVPALRALFPAGSMTGAPKLRTMQVIHDVESTPRGVYAGAFGWISGDGRADLGVVIRSLVATPAGVGFRYDLGTGGAITVRSDVAEEYAETRWKARRLLDAVADRPAPRMV
ncbi:MAG: anthranilate synthase component I family protein [Nocardioidaceae bacterium]